MCWGLDIGLGPPHDPGGAKLGSLEGNLRGKDSVYKSWNISVFLLSTVISYQTCSPAARPRLGVEGVQLPTPLSLQLMPSPPETAPSLAENELRPLMLGRN